jgi:hypothetical protein
MNPDCSAADTLILWQPEKLARLVRLSPTPYSTECLVRFEPGRWGGRQLGRGVSDGYQLVVAPTLGVEHHLLLTCAEPPGTGMPLAPVPDFDAWHPERLAATLAFWRFAQYPRVTQGSSVGLPAPTGRTLQAAFMIWALDLKHVGATDREIARAVWGDAPAVWSDSALRAQVRRFVKAAREHSARRYSVLLKPKRIRPVPT